MFRNFGRILAATAMIGLAVATTACKDGSFTINGEKGVPLSELDLAGKTPDEVAMFGPDDVRLRRGDKLEITVDGDEKAKEALRFTLSDGTLGIARTDWSKDNGRAVITVTMPLPAKLVMAGSGTITSEGLSGDKVEVTVAGSGTIDAGAIAAENLSVNVAGSGSLKGAGTAKKLSLTVAGSGDAQLDGLSVGEANVDVAGSGKTAFASDGTVRANIVGSGEVRVKGRATCKVNTVGSGQLVCENGVTPDVDGEAPEAPEPPAPGE